MNWENFSIEFTLNSEGAQLWAENSGEKVLDCSFENEKLDFAIKYDFLDKPPLHLLSAAQLGDKISVRKSQLYVF